MKIFFQLVLLFLPAVFFGQDNIIENRSAFVLQLFVDSSAMFKAPVQAGPYVVRDGAIQIFPGEKLYVEAVVENNRLFDLHVVKEIVHKERTMTIEFIQNHKGKMHDGMMLKIQNPFDMELRYTADMNLMDGGKWARTTVLPIHAGISSYELWPDVLTTLVLSDFWLKK